MKKNLYYFIVSLISLTPFSAGAFEPLENINVHGFLNQGYIHSPDTTYGGPDSEDGTFKFREAALNGSFRINDQAKVQGQVMYRELDAIEAGTTLDFLFVDYLMTSQIDSSFGVRVGRIKNEIGLYNSSRDIPGARPGILVPMSYLDSLREQMLSTDGIALYGANNFEESSFEYNVYVGKRKFDSTSRELYEFREDVPGEFSESTNAGFSLKLRPNLSYDLEFGVSAASFKFEIEDNLTVDEAAGNSSRRTNDHLLWNKTAFLHLDGYVQYGVGNWLLTFELTKMNNLSRNRLAYPVNPFTGQPVIDSNSGEMVPFFGNLDMFSVIRSNYIQAEYFLPNVSLFTRYEKVSFENTDLGSGVDAEALTLGARWFIGDGWSLAGELTMNEGELGLPVYDDLYDSHVEKGRWNAVLFQLTYQF